MYSPVNKNAFTIIDTNNPNIVFFFIATTSLFKLLKSRKELVIVRQYLYLR